VKHLHSKTELLQIPMLLIHTFRQGSVSLQINGIENVQLRIEDNKIDLNFLQKEQLRALLELEAGMEEESILERLRKLKNLAEKLRQDGFSIIISFRGQKMLTLGCEARPTISQMVTETNAIEVNNLVPLIILAK